MKKVCLIFWALGSISCLYATTFSTTFVFDKADSRNANGKWSNCTKEDFGKITDGKECLKNKNTIEFSVLSCGNQHKISSIDGCLSNIIFTSEMTPPENDDKKVDTTQTKSRNKKPQITKIICKNSVLLMDNAVVTKDGIIEVPLECIVDEKKNEDEDNTLYLKLAKEGNTYKIYLLRWQIDIEGGMFVNKMVMTYAPDKGSKMDVK